MNDIHRIRKVAGWWPAAIVATLLLGQTAMAQDVDSFQQDVEAVSCQQDLAAASYRQDIPLVSYAQDIPMVSYQQDLPIAPAPQDLWAASPRLDPMAAPSPQDVLHGPPLQGYLPAPYAQDLPHLPLEADDPIGVFEHDARPVYYQEEVPAVPNASTSTPEKIGQAPENTAEQFLREDTILLKQGEWQVDAGFSYTLDEKPFTQLVVTQPGSVVTPVASELRRRLMVADFALRYGLTDRLQFFADLPVGWTNTETSAIGSDSYLNDGGLGDTSCGVSYLLHKSDGESCDPDIVVSAGLTAPTSHGDFLADLLVTPQAELGQGFWAAYWNVLCIQTYDPVIVFYGFGSRHTFTRELDGFSVQAGDQYSYRMGVGFAVNERVTLSSTLFGSYITEPRVNGQIIPGTSLEPVYLRCAVTLAQRCDRICEPFVECGLTDDAVNTRMGITWTF